MAERKKKIKGEQPADDLATQIKKVAAGLYYTSETDAEIEPFTGNKCGDVTGEILLSQTGNAADSSITETSFDEFFNRLTEIQDWFGDEEKQTAAKFAALGDLLKNNLTNLKVFKIGQIEIDVYAVGLDAKSILAGIKTKSVET